MEEHYIRVILELDDEALEQHEEDDPAQPEDKVTRIIICMGRDGCLRLKRAAYIQSDIGFKRIVGFDEFEMASMDRDANTSSSSFPFQFLIRSIRATGVIFCRVYLNRHTAAAHKRIFAEIERIVRLDTGSDLRWRHLHGHSIDDFDDLILHWGADQHRGQAKGWFVFIPMTQLLTQSFPRSWAPSNGGCGETPCRPNTHARATPHLT